MEAVAYKSPRQWSSSSLIFAAQNKHTLHNYKIMLRVCLLPYTIPFLVCVQSNAQPFTLSGTNTPTRKAVAEHEWKQVGRDSIRGFLFTIFGPAHGPIKQFEDKRQDDGGAWYGQAANRQRGRVWMRSTTAILSRPVGGVMRRM